jgi:hypothetical protein
MKCIPLKRKRIATGDLVGEVVAWAALQGESSLFHDILKNSHCGTNTLQVLDASLFRLVAAPCFHLCEGT